MPLHIVRNDITKMEVDAIVNAANKTLLGGGGVDGCIHRAAGPKLLEECRRLHGCETGESKLTKGYDLPAKYVIHTVGPVWHGGMYGEKDKLISCYKTALELAKKYKCESVAFPLISAGVYAYPHAAALNVAVDTITEFLRENDMTVYIVVFDKKSYDIGGSLFKDIQAYIDDNYAEEHALFHRNRLQEESVSMMACEECVPDFVKSSLEELVEQADESFSEMLLRKIDEKGMTDAQCYKLANIDRKLFSKIRSDRLYKPSKPTAIAFILALKLPPEEAKDMLMKAGFALSHSSKFDIIVEYFITKGNYNVFEINEALFAFDQPLIGN